MATALMIMIIIIIVTVIVILFVCIMFCLLCSMYGVWEILPAGLKMTRRDLQVC